MIDIAVFIEGGGPLRDQQRELRAGFDAFFGELKKLAADKGKRLRLVACGSRNDAYDAFINERKYEPSTYSILLVDSEDVMMKGPKAHLEESEQRWKLGQVSEECLHIMATTMETWIIADPKALLLFYGQSLRTDQIPTHQPLDNVPKRDICRYLDAATKNCKSGVYHKMKHAPRLLAKLDPALVQEKCHCCERFFKLVRVQLNS